IDMARLAIDCYIECGKRFPDSHLTEIRLMRAFEIARSIGLPEKAVAVRETMFALLEHTSHRAHRAAWLFDLSNSALKLEPTDDQLVRLIAELEDQLIRNCAAENPCGLTAKGQAL